MENKRNKKVRAQQPERGEESGTGAAEDTIFALSSAYGKAGVAVFRVSGPRSGEILMRLTGRKKFTPREMFATKLKAPDGGTIDSAMAAFFRAPASYTGEDAAEIFIHGSVAVIEAMYALLSAFPGARIAEPGEFTRRAFSNGKLDLAQVEAVADLIEAETESQRRLALSSLGGGEEKLCRGWREELLQILAQAEASLDFSEDELPPGIPADCDRRMRKLAAEMEKHIESAERANLIRGGIDIAIVGRTNAGKSSLFNRIAGESRAIVSPKPGTTRDAIEARLDIEGWRANLSDTAGLNDRTRDAIEKKGIRKTREKMRTADIVVHVADNTADYSAIQAGPDVIAVFNKADRKTPPPGALAVSAKTGKGLEKLLREIAKRIKAKAGAPADAALSRRRHRNALAECALALKAALREAQPDLKAENIRMAANALGKISGVIHMSELLDEIFSSFCLGK